MGNRFSSVARVLVISCLGSLVLFTSACTTPAAGAAAAGTPRSPTACTSPSLNPYRLHQPPNQITKSFTGYKNGSISYDSARQDAFSQLGKSIRQWSDYQDVLIDEQRKVRVSITYLDPILVQYVVLNHAFVPPNHLMDQTWFTTQIQKAMDDLARREELLFIVTITVPAYENVLKVKFPINNLELVNASNLHIKPIHSDPPLDEETDVTRNLFFGYVGYPVAVSLGDCTGIMDIWTTSLTLNLKSSPSKDNPFYNLFWKINYQAIIQL